MKDERRMGVNAVKGSNSNIVESSEGINDREI